MERRLYHSVCLLLLPVLAVFVGVNLYLQLWASAAISAALLGLEFLFYALSRYKKLFVLSFAANGVLSYAALVLNYQVNSGADGPTISLFFLTLVLLLMATPRRWHSVWVVCHLAVLGTLYELDLMYPDWAPNVYHNDLERQTDHLVSYTIVILALYLLTNNLLRHYRQQRRLVADQTAVIAEKNRELLRSEGHLQAFFQNAAHGHILLDRSLRVLTFNREASALFRRIRAYTLHPGCAALEALSADDARQLQELCLKALQGQRCELELALPQSSGGVSWWRFAAGPASQADGSLLGVVLSAVSIQERVQHEARLRAQGATLVQIANLHAHSLRGPAASILGLVKLIREVGYVATLEDLTLLQDAAESLDARIHEIVSLTGQRPVATGEKPVVPPAVEES